MYTCYQPSFVCESRIAVVDQMRDCCTDIGLMLFVCLLYLFLAEKIPCAAAAYPQHTRHLWNSNPNLRSGFPPTGVLNSGTAPLFPGGGEGEQRCDKTLSGMRGKWTPWGQCLFLDSGFRREFPCTVRCSFC